MISEIFQASLKLDPVSQAKAGLIKMAGQSYSMLEVLSTTRVYILLSSLIFKQDAEHILKKESIPPRKKNKIGGSILDLEALSWRIHEPF